METIRKSRVNLWLVVSLVVAVVIITCAIVLPMFARARRASYFSQERMAARPDAEGLSLNRVGSRESRAAGSASTAAWGEAWAAAAPRMVISTADLDMEVSDVDKAHAEIAEITTKAGGFLTRSSVNTYRGRKTASVTIRVPAKGYSSVLAQAGKLGKVLSKDEKGEDVTEEYIDVQSRLRNLKREEEQFLKVLGRAGKITDILAVERELGRVRGEIERAAGRIQFLQNQVSLATINVTFTEPSPAVSKIVVWDILRTGKGAVNALEVVLRAIASLVIWAVIFVPLWALVGAVVYGYKGYRRKRSR